MEGDRFCSVLHCIGPDTIPCCRLTDFETVIHYYKYNMTAGANKTQAGPGTVHDPAEIDQGPAKMATFHLAPSLTMWCSCRIWVLGRFAQGPGTSGCRIGPADGELVI